MRNASIVILLCFCIPLMNCLDRGHSMQANSQDAPLDYYGIVIDAGSSGTRVHLYHQTSTYDFKEVDKACKIKSRLTDFEKNPEQSHEEILKCLKKDEITQLKGKEDKTVFVLGATAGMRVLDYRNNKAYFAILKSLRNNFKQLPYRVAYIDTIYGFQEAYYAWMTVNQLNGYFKNHNLNPSFKQRSVGALDLGGASAQISFLNRNAPRFQDGTFTLTVFDKQYHVYGISLLCYGLDMIKSRLLAQILKDNNFASECENPCTQTGDVMKVPKKVIFQKPCVYGNEEEFGLNIPPPDNAPNEYTFKGKMDMEKCLEYLVKTFKSKHARRAYERLSRGVPDAGQEFYATSGYYFTVKGLGLPQKHTSRQFAAKLKENCETPASSGATDTNYKTHTKWTCMAGIYMELLLQFLRVDHLWNNIDFTNEVNGISVNWALGFMMDKVRVLKTKRQPYKHKK